LGNFELAHLKGAQGLEYGQEAELRAHTGFALRYDATTSTCDYVRTVDPLGREIAYWVADEWKEDPALVMGAILGSLVRGRPLEVAAKRSQSKPGAELLRRLIREALAYKTEAFENDWNISGSDLTQWFAGWRQRAAAALEGDSTRSQGIGTKVPTFATSVTLYVQANTSSDYGQAPYWAKVVLTPELFTRVQQLREVVHATGVSCISDWGDPDLWSSERAGLTSGRDVENDDLEAPLWMDQGFLKVSKDRFWYEACPKHRNYTVSTQPIAFDALLEALAGPQEPPASAISVWEMSSCTHGRKTFSRDHGKHSEVSCSLQANVFPDTTTNLVRERFNSDELCSSGFSFAVVTGGGKLRTWGCGQELGLPGGSSCIHTTTRSARSSSTSSWASVLGRPFGIWAFRLRTR